eukprot:TRINITY_DN25629_c0_g1_i4.p1 TRINITY_DN25629_c0_g1~~TRINITY_DN25629_c0_g1_i4.p1  ORF type:complete len:499 (+),score=72.81 TRINITY_DN25629_c0_g1_i4:62-1558(+)
MELSTLAGGGASAWVLLSDQSRYFGSKAAYYEERCWEARSEVMQLKRELQATKEHLAAAERRCLKLASSGAADRARARCAQLQLRATLEGRQTVLRNAAARTAKAKLAAATRASSTPTSSLPPPAPSARTGAASIVSARARELQSSIPAILCWVLMRLALGRSPRVAARATGTQRIEVSDLGGDVSISNIDEGELQRPVCANSILVSFSLDVTRVLRAAFSNSYPSGHSWRGVPRPRGAPGIRRGTALPAPPELPTPPRVRGGAVPSVRGVPRPSFSLGCLVDLGPVAQRPTGPPPVAERGGHAAGVEQPAGADAAAAGETRLKRCQSPPDGAAAPGEAEGRDPPAGAADSAPQPPEPPRPRRKVSFAGLGRHPPVCSTTRVVEARRDGHGAFTRPEFLEYYGPREGAARWRRAERIQRRSYGSAGDAIRARGCTRLQTEEALRRAEENAMANEDPLGGAEGGAAAKEHYAAEAAKPQPPAPRQRGPSPGGRRRRSGR